MAYQKIYGLIKNEIERGNYPIGTFLPIEADLEEIYKVSRTTIRKAMKLLADEEYVEIRQGRGTMVLDHKAQQDFNGVTSVTESLRNKGYEVTTQSMYIDIIPASVKLQSQLKLRDNEEIARIQRIQLADGKPICIMNNYIPYSLVPEIEQYNGKFSALYEFLEKNYQIMIENTEDIIYAAAAELYEAQVLNVTPGTSLLYIDRICYAKEKPICRDEVKIIGSRYEVRVCAFGRKK